MLLIFWPVSIYARPSRLRVSISKEAKAEEFLRICRLTLMASFQWPERARSMACKEADWDKRELSISVKVYGGVVK